MFVARTTCGWLALLFLLPLGCGGGGDGKLVESDEEQVKHAIREFNDLKGNAKGFASCFATGAAPPEAQRKGYLKNAFAPGKVSGKGDTVTIQVKIMDEPREKVFREVEWTCVKENGQWKLKAAPLQ